jgi:hypothetical protein
MPVAERTCTNCQAAIEPAQDRVNPVIKAEFVLLCALSTFVISAAIWCINVPQKKAMKAAKVEQSSMSEIDRLFAQAKKVPIVPVMKPTERSERMLITSPRSESPAKSIAAKPAVAENEPTISEITKPAVSKVEVAKVQSSKNESAKPEELKPESSKIEATTATKPSGRSKSVDDVAEYNKALAAFFERSKAAEATDTVDGATPATAPPEPPGYEEWLKAGKPSF